MFTDIEGSTILVTRLGDAWGDVLERHQRIVRDVLAGTDGSEVDTEGDAFFVVFDDARRAAAACGRIHAALADETWPQDIELKIRIGLHTGSVEERDGRYIGLDVHKAARVGAAAHGGQTLVSETTALLVVTGSGDNDLRDLGEHRLKDIPGTVHLFQLGAGSFPPPRALDGRVLRLPSLWSDLVGRGGDAARVGKEWANGARLVTLVGPAGVGKSSLALTLAHRRVDAGDGAAMVALAAVREPVEVLPQIARTLDAAGADLAAVTAALGGSRTVLVLDNFEQVRAAASTVTALLEAMPDLDILVTSQAPLHAAGEHVVYLDPLPLPSSDRYNDVVSSPAVAMFRERVLAVDPDFDLDVTNASAVAGICRRLDGNPLALELAAARCRSMTPQQLLERLDRSLALLRSRADDVDARHASLESSLDWTLSLLPDDARALVDGLGVFEGGWTLEVLEQVSAGAMDDDPVDVLWAVDDLVDLSVIRRVADSGTRLTWPPALRDLARRRLAATPEREERWEAAHASAFLQMLEAIADDDTGSRDDDLPHAEMPNLRRAIEWATAHDTRIHVRLVAALAPVAQLYGAELRPHLDAALAAVGDDDLAWGRLQTIAAYFCHFAGDNSGALALLGQADELWQRLDRPVLRARGLIEQAYLLASGDPDDRRADAWLDTADALIATAGVNLNRAVFMRAQLMVIRHDVPGAQAVLEHLVQLRSHGQLRSEDEMYRAHLTGDCQLLTGDFAAARQTYGAALRNALQRNELAQASIEAQGVAMALGGLGRHAEAACLAGAAAGIQQELDFQPDYRWWIALMHQLITDPGIGALGEAHTEAVEAGKALGLNAGFDRALELSA